MFLKNFGSEINNGNLLKKDLTIFIKKFEEIWIFLPKDLFFQSHTKIKYVKNLWMLVRKGRWEEKIHFF